MGKYTLFLGMILACSTAVAGMRTIDCSSSERLDAIQGLQILFNETTEPNLTAGDFARHTWGGVQIGTAQMRSVFQGGRLLSLTREPLVINPKQPFCNLDIAASRFGRSVRSRRVGLPQGTVLSLVNNVEVAPNVRGTVARTQPIVSTSATMILSDGVHIVCHHPSLQDGSSWRHTAPTVADLCASFGSSRITVRALTVDEPAEIHSTPVEAAPAAE